MLNNRKHKIGWILAALCLMAAASSNVSADIAVVMGAKAGVDTLEASQVKALFLGKAAQLPNGDAVAVVNQSESAKIYADFARLTLDKTMAQLKSYWASQIFSGQGVPPKVLDNDAAVKAYVAGTPGGIGYIDSASVDGTVKVVFTAK